MKRICFFVLALVGLFFVNQTQAALEWGPGLKVLIVGGGWAHDYDTWYKNVDTASLQKAGISNTHYTATSEEAASELTNVDVLVLCGNKPGFDTPEFQVAFSNFVAAGKGIVLLHASIWYNWHWGKKDSDGFNLKFVGGGARDHDGVSEFTETVVKDHPVTKGLPPTFKVSDELYHIAARPGAAPMEVLMEAAHDGGQKYASVWLVNDNPSRIVCIALGHDGGAHNSPDYQKLVANAIRWVGKQ